MFATKYDGRRWILGSRTEEENLVLQVVLTHIRTHTYAKQTKQSFNQIWAEEMDQRINNKELPTQM